MPNLVIGTPETLSPVEVTFGASENGFFDIYLSRDGSTPVKALSLGGTDGSAIVFRQPGLPSTLGFSLDGEGRIKFNGEA